MFTQRENSLLDATRTRIDGADALTIDAMLREIEASPEYTDAGHADHNVYVNMRPLFIGKQLELSGIDPTLSGNDADSSMTDNQVYTHELYAEDKPLDFTQDEAQYNKQRERAVDYLSEVQASDGDDKNVHIEAAQKNIVQIDVDYDASVQTRNAELARMDAQQDTWDDEQATRSQQMEKDFMAVRLKGVLKSDLRIQTELATQEWQRLQQAYGY